MASTAAQTGEKTGETTGETGETTAGTVAAEPIRRKALRQAWDQSRRVPVVAGPNKTWGASLNIAVGVHIVVVTSAVTISVFECSSARGTIQRLVRGALDGLLPEPLSGVLERGAEQRAGVAAVLDELDE
jgi:hypothetical protein